MLYTSLILSAILLVSANVVALRFARSAHHPGRLLRVLAVCALVLISFCILSGGFFHTAVAVQLILLSVTWLLWRVLQRGPAFFLMLSLAATAAAYAITMVFVLQDVEKYARLRERFPYESIEDRLPKPPSQAGLGPLPDRTHERLTDLEQWVGSEGDLHRAEMLRLLHEERVKLFVSSPGFGRVRMVRPYERGLSLEPRARVPQLSLSTYAPESAGEKAPEPKVWEGEHLNRLHKMAIVDFAYPEGFGFIKDRRHVAGFQPHQFGRTPEPAEQWEVWRLELVGLLLHEKPVAYVTEHLPRMDELGEAATRSLDPFEASALEKLRQGEDLLYTEASAGMRMLGAIRSVKQCMGCHGGERGDLLGAFSYTLRRR